MISNIKIELNQNYFSKYSLTSLYKILCSFFANASVGASNNNNLAIDAFFTLTYSSIHVLPTTTIKS